MAHHAQIYSSNSIMISNLLMDTREEVELLDFSNAFGRPNHFLMLR